MNPGATADSRAFVSVVVPMRNAERTLASCLDALVAQDYPADRREILVVDNGSTDGSMAIARRRAAVRLFVEPRPGSYNARNRGVAESRGTIVAFIDPDCEPARDWLAAIDEAMADPAIQVVCGPRLAGGRSPLLRSLIDYEIAKDARVLGGDDPTAIYGYTANLAARRRLFEEVGPFADLARGADALWVQGVVRRVGVGAVRFVAAMVVTHHEMSDIGVYFRKVHVYARARVRADSILPIRTLGARERWAVYRAVGREKRYPLARRLLLLGALVVGAAVWSVATALEQRRTSRIP